MLRTLGPGVAAIGLAACGSNTVSGSSSGGSSRGPTPATARTVRTSWSRTASSAAICCTAEGVPMNLELTITDLANGGVPFAGVAASTSGTATATGRTPCTRRGSRTRTICGRADRRCQRSRQVHQHLPGPLQRTMTAHPLRGIRRPGQHHRRLEYHRDVAGRPAAGDLRPGIRAIRLCGLGEQPRPDEPADRPRPRRRRRVSRLATVIGTWPALLRVPRRRGRHQHDPDRRWRGAGRRVQRWAGRRAPEPLTSGAGRRGRWISPVCGGPRVTAEHPAATNDPILRTVAVAGLVAAVAGTVEPLRGVRVIRPRPWVTRDVPAVVGIVTL